MKWFFWNVRGMNKRYKQKEIKLLLQNNKVTLAGLIETRVKENNVKTILKGIAPGWRILHNYTDSPNGRIWVVWDDNWCDIKLIITQLKSCIVMLKKEVRIIRLY